MTPENHDFRSYLDVLEPAGQLTRIQKTVSLEFELAQVAAGLPTLKTSPARVGW